MQPTNGVIIHKGWGEKNRGRVYRLLYSITQEWVRLLRNRAYNPAMMGQCGSPIRIRYCLKILKKRHA